MSRKGKCSSPQGTIIGGNDKCHVFLLLYLQGFALYEQMHSIFIKITGMKEFNLRCTTWYRSAFGFIRNMQQLSCEQLPVVIGDC